jgi:MFS family permease
VADVTAATDESLMQPGLARPGWLATTFDAFSVPAYRLLWLNSFIMLTAVHLAFTAQNVVAFDITGNNRAVGFVAFAQGIAMLVTTPLAGVIADRVPKRLLLCLAELILGVMAVMLTVLIYTDALTIELLALAAFLFGASISFFWPAQTALMGDVIREEQQANGAALFQVCLNSTRSFAPFVAGGLLAWSLVESGGTYLLTALLFVPILISGWLLPETGTTSSGRRMWQEVRLGLQHVRERRRLLEATITFIVVTLLGFSVMVILPGFTKEEFGAGNAGFGIMFGVNAIGALVASLWTASLAGSRFAPALVAVTTFLFGVLIAITGLMPTFALAILAFALVGAAGGAFQTLVIAAMLRNSAPEYFGRVMSLTTIAWSLTNLLGLFVGIFADIFSERMVLVGVGISVSTAALLIMLWSRRPEVAWKAEA